MPDTGGQGPDAGMPPAAAGHELVRLRGGAMSIRSRPYAETMHPVIGPAAEAEGLYVRELRLRERLAQGAEEFVIWDVGLGAAANVLAVLGACGTVPANLRIVSFDATLEPLRFALAHRGALPFLAGFAETLERLASSVPPGSATPAKAREAPGATTPPRPDGDLRFKHGQLSVRWELRLGDFPSLLAGDAAADWPAPHAILFDPFSPKANPAMWTLPLFRNLFARLAPGRGCGLATYSRSTMARVALLLAGFHVGAGAASGAKEETTVAANTPALLARPLDRRWLERARRSAGAEPLAGPVYRQAPLSAASLERLLAHPQFR